MDRLTVSLSILVAPAPQDRQIIGGPDDPPNENSHALATQQVTPHPAPQGRWRLHPGQSATAVRGPRLLTYTRPSGQRSQIHGPKSHG